MTRSHKEEEHRRLETQAAEIAEIEFRRKRMALKAEARKRQEAATEQMNQSPEPTNTFEELFDHDEEKKVNEDSFAKYVNSKSIESSQNIFAKSRKSYNKFIGVTAGEANSLVHAPELESINNDVAKKSEVAETEIREHSVRKIPAFSQGKRESLIAKRMRELMMSNENRLSTKDPIFGVDNNNVFEDNTNMSESEGKITSSKPVLETGSTRRDDEEPREIQNTHERESNLDPTELQSVKNNRSPKRISRTSATYQEYIRTMRSESEQKRIDDMHSIFGQAGLLSRVKRTNIATVQVEDGAIFY